MKPDLSTDTSTPDIQSLRIRLREELLSLREQGDQSYPISPAILQSKAYEKILDYIKNERIITDKDTLWNEIEELVISVSPEFKSRLQLLTDGKLKPSDLHLALLIKCGISSTNMAKLVGRSKSTIPYRKNALGSKVFDHNLESGVIEDIISLL